MARIISRNFRAGPAGEETKPINTVHDSMYREIFSRRSSPLNCLYTASKNQAGGRASVGNQLLFRFRAPAGSQLQWSIFCNTPERFVQHVSLPGIASYSFFLCPDIRPLYSHLLAKIASYWGLRVGLYMAYVSPNY